MFEKISWTLIKILFMIFFIMLLVYLFHEAQEVGYKVFSDRAKDTEKTAIESIITVTEKESLLNIAKDLERAGLVKNAYITAMAFRTMDDYDQIKPGEYIMRSSMRPSEMMKIMIGEDEQE